MKLYLFNSTEDWDTDSALGIIAETEAQAWNIYERENGKKDNINVKSYRLRPGTIIEPEGFDEVSISAKYTHPWIELKRFKIRDISSLEHSKWGAVELTIGIVDTETGEAIDCITAECEKPYCNENLVKMERYIQQMRRKLWNYIYDN